MSHPFPITWCGTHHEITVGPGSIRGDAAITTGSTASAAMAATKLTLPPGTSGAIYIYIQTSSSGTAAGFTDDLSPGNSFIPLNSVEIARYATNASGVTSVVLKNLPDDFYLIFNIAIVQTVSQLAALDTAHKAAIVTGSNTWPQAGDGLDGAGIYFLQLPDSTHLAANGVASTKAIGTYWFRAVTSGLSKLENAARTEAAVGVGNLLWIPGSATLGSASVSYRVEFTAAVDCTHLRLHWAGQYSSGGVLVNFTTTLKASIQLADANGDPTGGAIPVTFGANGLTGTIPGGGVLRSDPVPITLAAGRKFFVITYSPTATMGINGNLSNRSGNNFYAGDAAANPALFTNDQSQAGAVSFGPGMITGLVLPKNSRAVLMIGDSIAANSNDCTSLNVRGWLGRALGTSRAVVNAAIGGSRASGQAGQAGYYLAFYAAAYCDLAVYAPGFNDFYGDGAPDASTRANATTIVGNLRRMGMRKVVGCTVKPGTTSTDGWLTTANQAARSGDAARQTYNAWVLAQVNGLFDGVFDLAAAIAANGNPSLLATGPATVIYSGTAGASSSPGAIWTASGAVGDISWAGATVSVVHAGTTYYGQIASFRPGSSSNAVIFSNALTGCSPGDTFTVYNSWCGDVTGVGAHPNGYGHVQIAGQFPLNLLD